MDEMSTVELKRDCDAVRIPSGEPARLSAGESVEIVQTLGGAYTVRTMDGLFRLNPQDADALGREAEKGSSGEAEARPESQPDLAEERVWEALRNCYDPEIPVNIVDLGLVYSLRIGALPSGKQKVSVTMTLTAPGCGMGPVIAGDAQQRILDLPGVEEAEVEVVWDPPWHHSMISPAGRSRLGLDE